MKTLPDHSSLTRIRDRYGVDTFRRFFERIVEQCQKAGLVWGRNCISMAPRLKPMPTTIRCMPRFYVEAMQAHLAVLFPDDSAQPHRQPERAPRRSLLADSVAAAHGPADSDVARTGSRGWAVQPIASRTVPTSASPTCG